MKPRIRFLVTEDWYFWSHRLDLARAARDAGYEVQIATRVRDYRKRIEDEGFVLFPLNWKRRSLNPYREFKAFLEIIHLYCRERPALVHHVALKPILYGTWAARVAAVPGVVNAITGLGRVTFIDTWPAASVHFILLRVLKWALALPNSCAMFQNVDDATELSEAKVIDSSHAVIIRGSGVDTVRFSPAAETPGEPVIMLAARMLWPKGIGEFIAAIRLLNEQGIRARYVLVGMIDHENPAHIPECQLREWQEQRVIEWWGYREDMPQVLRAAHVVVLPTYYGEGLPKVLLEAAACARPLIATRICGCSDIVRHDENGFLIPPKNPEALARAIEKLIRAPELRARMGLRGREIVMNEFSIQRIAQETLAVYRMVLHNSVPGAAITPSV